MSIINKTQPKTGIEQYSIQHKPKHYEKNIDAINWNFDYVL